MKALNWGLFLGLSLAPSDSFAQNVVTQTISIATGNCSPTTSIGGLAETGGAEGGAGVPAGSGLGTGVGPSGPTVGNSGSAGAGSVVGTSGPQSTSSEGGAVPSSSTIIPLAAASTTGGSGVGGPLPSGVKTTVGSNGVSNGTYQYLGFFAVPTTGSLLNGPVTATGARFSGYMTLESCAYICRKIPYFAVQNGTDCSCGTVGPSSTPVNDPPMLINCPGDVTEVCGATGFGIVYRGAPLGTLPVTIVGQMTTTDSMGSTTIDPTTAVWTPPFSSQTAAASEITTAMASSSAAMGMDTATSSEPALESSTVAPDTTSTDSQTPTVAESSAAVSSSAAQSNEMTTTTSSAPSTAESIDSASTLIVPSATIAMTVVSTSLTPVSSASSTTVAAGSSLIASSAPSSTAAPTSPSASLPASNTPVPSVVATPTTPIGATGPAEPTLIAVPSCPASGANSNNTRYVDLFDQTYDIRCGIDVVGSQKTTAHADTFLRCLQYCDLLDGCVGVTYVDVINQYNNNTNCNSYYSFEGYSPVSGTPDGDFYSGVNVHGAPTNGVTDPSSGANTNDDLCAAPATTDYGPDVYGACYQIGCGQTIGQGDTGTLLAPTVLSSLLGCSLYCSFYNTCVTVTWTGFVAGQATVNCFPKSSYNTTVATNEDGTDFAFNGKCPGS